MDNKKELQTLLENISGDLEKNQHHLDSQLSSDRKENISNFLRGFKTFVDNISSVNSSELYSIIGDCTNHVICLGATGTGKSTAINHLIGNELECIKLGRHGRAFQIMVNNKENQTAVIGNTDDSQTGIITPYINTRENIVYWDFPGFLDTQGDLQRIQNAYLMKEFCETVKVAKIILFVDISAITSSRGVSYISFIDMLTSICDPKLVQKNMGLIITKIDSFESEVQKEEEKKEFVQKFANFYKERSRSGILEILGNESMLKKLGFFEKPGKTGVLSQNMFSDMKLAVEAVEFSFVNFILCVDSDTNTRLSNVAKLLNTYAKQITTYVAQAQMSKVILIMNGNNFNRDMLTEIAPFCISCKKDKFIEELQKSAQFSDFQASLETLKNILQTLDFFNKITSNIDAEIFSWAEPLRVFDCKYKLLCDIENNIVEGVQIIQAAVLSSSYLQNILKKTKTKTVECYSLTFVVDEDLNLPGVSLSIASKTWIIKGNKNISLKGNSRKNSIFNTGNFYGYAEKIMGGHIALDIDGVDGENGTFDLGHVYPQIHEKQEEIKAWECYLGALKHLKSKYKGKNLADEIKGLTEKQQIACNKENVEIELNLVKMLSEMRNIRDSYKGIPKSYVPNSNTKCYGQKDKEILRSGIQKVQDDLSETEKKISQLLTSDPNNLEEMFSILTKTEEILSSLTNFVESHSSHYLEWKERKQVAKIEYTKKLIITVAGNNIQLSAKDLNAILTDKTKWFKQAIKSKFETLIENQVREHKKALDSLNKMVQDTEEGIKDLLKQQKKVIYCEDDKAAKLTSLQTELRKAKKESTKEFDELFKKINYILKATEMKNEAIHKYCLLLWEKDNCLRDPTSKSFQKPEKRKFYGNINETEFYTNYISQIQKMEDRANRFNRVKDYIRTKIHVKLIDSANALNRLVSSLQVTGQKAYVVDINETDVLLEYKVVSGYLKNQLQKDKYFTKYFKTVTESVLDEYAKSHISSQNDFHSLKNAKMFKDRMINALENYKEINEMVQIAIQDYNTWKYQQKSVLNQFSNIFSAYDRFKLSEKNLIEAVNEEGNIIKSLLFKNTNLAKRVERNWSDRNFASKAGQVMRSLFTMNNQYYETYQLRGSEGSPGNDSGLYCLEGNWKNCISISNKPGNGGQHACTIEGTYLNEYAFAPLQLIYGMPEVNITPVVSCYTTTASAAVAQGVAEAASAAATKAVAESVAAASVAQAAKETAKATSAQALAAATMQKAAEKTAQAAALAATQSTTQLTKLVTEGASVMPVVTSFGDAVLKNGFHILAEGAAESAVIAASQAATQATGAVTAKEAAKRAAIIATNSAAQASTMSSITTFGAAALGYASFVGFAASIPVAYMNSGWVDGPYKSYPGSAQRTEKQLKEGIIFGIKNNSAGESLKNIFSDDIFSFF